MNEIKTGGPAFPTAEIFHDEVVYTGGMTLRDYFAAKAMQGLVSSAKIDETIQLNEAAGWSYKMADALLKVRDVE
jgi:hypothetical protein